MTAAVVTPAVMPGARRLCAYSEQGGLYRCVRKADHSGRHTPRRQTGAVPITGPTADRVEPSTPPAGPAGTSSPTTPRADVRVAHTRPDPRSVLATVDALEVATRSLRWSVARALTDGERALARQLYEAIATRVGTEAGSGVTSPTPDPPPE